MKAGARRDRRQDLPVRAEINVTSLVDVAFTLLVIFIITDVIGATNIFPFIKPVN